MGSAHRSETSFEKHDVLCVILNFDPLVIYGTTVQTHGIATVFPLNLTIMSLFNEDNILSKYTNLTYGPLKSKNTNST